MTMWDLLLIVLSPFAAFGIAFALRFLIETRKGRQLPEARPKPEKQNFFVRLFWDFPKAYFEDAFNRDPDEFREYGVHMICGEQGSGKTVTLAYLLRQYQEQYPKMKVRTNFDYYYEDGAITSWKDLVFENNGTLGQIDVLDEIQNWFASNQSKDFPMDMLQEITQQRKQRKCIFCTSQVFTRVGKPLREQVNFLYLPMTVFGCLTIVRVYKPKFSDDGTIKKMSMRKMFFYVHDYDLRHSFDTYHKVEMMSNAGFQPRQPETSVTVNTAPEKKKGMLGHFKK